MRRRNSIVGRKPAAAMAIRPVLRGVRGAEADARSSGTRGQVGAADRHQEIEVTRRGKPVAAVVSVRELARLRGAGGSFAAAYRKFLEKHNLAKEGLDEEFAASLRDKGAGRSVSL